MRELLGGKGANVAEMTRVLGAERVPAGFTITTEACVAYMRDGRSCPTGMEEQVAEALERLEEHAGKRLGDHDDPLLVSVRSGARESMPGHARHRPEPRAQRRVGRGARARDRERALRLGLLPALRADVRQRLPRHRRASSSRTRSSRGQARPRRQARHRARRRRAAGARRRAFKELYDFPQDPQEQLAQAIRAVFDSWTGERAVDYRRINRIPDDWGTAVNVQQMVFGNKGETSRLRRRVQPRRGHRRARAVAATSSSTPRARTSSPACATRATSPRWPR